MTGANWFKTVATIGITVSTALAPTFGKDKWYVILAAVTGAVALVAGSVTKSGA